MSQRSDNFKGGRKPDTPPPVLPPTAHSTATPTATLETPLKPVAVVSLEPALRAATKRLRASLCNNPNTPLTWRPGWSTDQISDHLAIERGHVPGMRPDGGAWFQPDNPAPLVVAEAKKQGEDGNAIERWYKNYATARALDCGVYVTFCSGDGFFNNARPQMALELALALDPAERHRLEQGAVWNRPVGRIWLYRWRDVGSVPPSALESVLRSALRQSLSTRQSLHL